MKTIRKTRYEEYFKLWIKEIRRRLSITQTGLALRCGVAVSTVQNWELRTWPSSPSLTLLNQLAKEVGLKPFKIPGRNIVLPGEKVGVDENFKKSEYFNESDASQLGINQKSEKCLPDCINEEDF